MFGLELEGRIDNVLWVVVSLLESAYKISAIEIKNGAKIKNELRTLLFPDDTGCNSTDCFTFFLFIKFIRLPSNYQ